MQNRLRSIFTLLISSVMSFLSLILLNVLIPRYMGVEQYGDWRKASLVLVMGGVVHLGLADGLFNKWVSEKSFRLPQNFVFASILLIFTLSITYTYLMLKLNYIRSEILPEVVFSIFTYGIFSITASYIQSHSDRFSYPVYFLMQPVLLVICTLSLVYANSISMSYLFLSYGISFLVPTLLLAKSICSTSGVLSISNVLLNPFQGSTIMAANIFLLLAMNIDKLLLGITSKSTVFGSYSLLSALPFAASTIGFPVGMALYARKTNLIHTKVFAGVCAFVGASIFYAVFKEYSLEVLRFYPAFDFSLLPIFLIVAVLVFIMSVAYFPVRRYTQSRIFAFECLSIIFLIGFAIFIGKFIFGDHPYVYIVSFGISFFLWMVGIDLSAFYLRYRSQNDRKKYTIY